MNGIELGGSPSKFETVVDDFKALKEDALEALLVHENSREIRGTRGSFEENDLEVAQSTEESSAASAVSIPRQRSVEELIALKPDEL